jgi:hypothetical protein
MTIFIVGEVGREKGQEGREGKSVQGHTLSPRVHAQNEFSYM